MGAGGGARRARRCDGFRSIRRPVSCRPTTSPPCSCERTRVVAVTAASNLIGTRPDVAAISPARPRRRRARLRRRRSRGGPQAHRLDALGADIFMCSPYKFLGPHLGVLAARPALLETLSPGQADADDGRRARSDSSSARCPTRCSPECELRSTSSPDIDPGHREQPTRAAGQLVAAIETSRGHAPRRDRGRARATARRRRALSGPQPNADTAR